MSLNSLTVASCPSSSSLMSMLNSAVFLAPATKSDNRLFCVRQILSKKVLYEPPEIIEPSTDLETSMRAALTIMTIELRKMIECVVQRFGEVRRRSGCPAVEVTTHQTNHFGGFRHEIVEVRTTGIETIYKVLGEETSRVDGKSH